MLTRTAAEVAAAVRGRVVSGSHDAVVRGVSIDSRAIEAGDLFVAIRGPRHDGHRFVSDAAGAGATVVLADADLDAPDGATVVRVADTTEALAALACDERARRQIPVLALTGSSGKTTTRELASAALSARFRVGSTQGNLNNHWGLPLSILRIDDGAQIAVLEMGMNHAGEIAALTRIAAPACGLITNIGSAHLGFFPDERALGRAKVELLQEMPAESTGVVNADNALLMELARETGRTLVTFGIDEEADLRGRDVSTSLSGGTRFSCGETRVTLSQWGRHSAANALAALAAAHCLGVPVEDAAPRLADVANMKGRGSLHRLAHGGVLVDESYNANPAADEAVLKALGNDPWKGRRVAVLGDMLELGDHAARLHHRVGRVAATSGVDRLLAVGGFASHVADGAASAGLEDVAIHDDAGSAANALLEEIDGSELLLVKGSRGVHLERVAESVLDRFAQGVGA